MPEQHAYLSASKAYQWSVCTPSARLNAAFPDKRSDAAEEGTLAHSIVETKLRRMIVGKPRGETPASIQKNPMWSKAMDDYVDQYLDFVEEKANAFKAAGHEPVVYSEIRLDLTEWVPEGFGTADTVIIADGTMAVIDFKYGKGVAVSAPGNPQLRLYGAGAYNEFSLLYDIENVDLCIFQPRIENVSEESLTVAELMDWANTKIKPAAELAMKGLGQTVCGDHCKFCKASAICPAHVKEMLSVIDWETRDPQTLTRAEIGKLLPLTDFLTAWIKDLKEYAFEQASSGDGIPGYKIVAGRSVRKITDEAAAAKILLDAGATDIYELKSLTGLEEAVGKKRLGDLLKDLIVKPAGKPTLVPVSDKRPEINLFDDAKEN